MVTLQIHEKDLVECKYDDHLKNKLLHARWSIPYKKDCIRTKFTHPFEEVKETSEFSNVNKEVQNKELNLSDLLQ